jgi:hypothetical protein
MATCLMLIFIPCEATIGAVQNTKEPMANSHISLHNERLSIKAKAVPLQDLLDRIAKTCDLRIFLASADKAKNLVDVDMHERTIEQTLKQLLRGNSYLVVYNEANEKTGLSIMPGTSILGGLETEFSASQPSSTVEARKARQARLLRNQIKRLDRIIARGTLDISDQTAIETNTLDTVAQERKQLKIYQERLAALEDEM